MASGLNSSASNSIPNWWQRKLQPSGNTYPDHEQHSANAVALTPDFQIAVSKEGDKAPFPIEMVPAQEHQGYNAWNFGLLQSKYPELNILAHEDHQPISNVGMFSETFNTEHDGFYLSKK